ncbi:MAG TPA: hypothetical protein VIG25_25630 [Pyrinomonadaceae bacterium]|jgi:hypothetical protein
MKRRTQRKYVVIVLASLSVAALIGGSFSPIRTAAAGKRQIDAPTISCAGGTQVSRNITVCAPSTINATGLPAGFSLQWMTCDAFAANNNQWFASDDPRLAKASFSGNANSSRYNLAPGECMTVNVGDLLFDEGASTNNTSALSCGTCYVFRAFGHATNILNRSTFTDNLNCSTADCGNQGICTLTFSQWKSLGPICDPGADFASTPTEASGWSLTSITLGTVTYPDVRVTCILDWPANGNGLVTLAHQLIAAKLNQAMNSGLPPSVATCVNNADALIGGLVVPPVGADFLDPSVTTALTQCLSSYNEGAVGPGVCHGQD